MGDGLAGRLLPPMRWTHVNYATCPHFDLRTVNEATGKGCAHHNLRRGLSESHRSYDRSSHRDQPRAFMVGVSSAVFKRKSSRRRR